MNNRRTDDGAVQIVTGGGFRLTVLSDLTTSEPDSFDLLDIFRINDFGEFCGAKVEVGKGKNKDPGGAFRYWPEMVAAPEILLQSGSTLTRGMDINSNGDVVTVSFGGLYHDDHGLLQLRDIIVDGGSCSPRGITERDATTGLPMICGHSDGQACVLIPVELP